MPAAVPAMERPSTREPAGWTGERVGKRIQDAWRASPRTAEDTAVMAWSELYLPTDSDLRLAVRMVGLNASAPRTYPLRQLVRDRLGWSWNRFHRNRTRAFAAIAERLNAGFEPLVTRVVAA